MYITFYLLKIFRKWYFYRCDITTNYYEFLDQCFPNPVDSLPGEEDERIASRGGSMSHQGEKNCLKQFA